MRPPPDWASKPQSSMIHRNKAKRDKSRLLAGSRHANQHGECLLSETLRKSRFSAVRAVDDPRRTIRNRLREQNFMRLTMRCDGAKKTALGIVLVGLMLVDEPASIG